MTYIQDSFDEIFKISNRLFYLTFIVVVGVHAPVRRPAICNYSSFESKVVFQPGSSLDGTLVGRIEAMNIQQQRISLNLGPHFSSRINEDLACHDL